MCTGINIGISGNNNNFKNIYMAISIFLLHNCLRGWLVVVGGLLGFFGCGLSLGFLWGICFVCLCVWCVLFGVFSVVMVMDSYCFLCVLGGRCCMWGVGGCLIFVISP